MDNLSNLPPGCSEAHINRHFAEDKFEPIIAKDWIDGLEHDSPEFKAFIDFLFTHFDGQIKLAVEAFIMANGYDMFKDYLESMDEV